MIRTINGLRRFFGVVCLALLIWGALSPASAATWQGVDVAVGSDSKARLLWTAADGRMALWTIDSTGGFVSSDAYGPYSGWTASRIAAGGDGLTRVLWNNTNGTAALWLLDSNNNYMASAGWGPYPGWTAVDISVGTDNRTRILWKHPSDTTMVLWSVGNSFDATAGYVYNIQAYATLGVPSAVSAGQDGLTGVLMSNPPVSGQSASDGWLMDSAGSLYRVNHNEGGPNGGSDTYLALDVAVTSDNYTRVLSVRNDGVLLEESYNVNGVPIGQLGLNNPMGPYPGWTPRAMAAGATGPMWVLWNKTDGTMAIWLVGLNNSYQTSFAYGPF